MRPPPSAAVAAGSAGIVSRRAHVGLPLVVLADEEKRQLPDGGEVDRLVEDAFAGRAVAEEDGGDRAGFALAHLLRERDAGRERELAADDRRGEDDAELGDRDVQRAALALAVAVDAAHHLGDQAAGIGAAREQVAGAAVVGEDAVARLERADDADGRGLLADRRAGAGRGRRGAGGERLFVGADQQHGFEHRDAMRGGGVHRGLPSGRRRGGRGGLRWSSL